MVWSKWRGAVLVLLAWVALALCQTSAQSPRDTTERYMTVHENGLSTRCKILATWTLPDGATAYQLQALGTGEMLTVVQNGQATARENNGGRSTLVPMRVYHWTNGTPP